MTAGVTVPRQCIVIITPRERLVQGMKRGLRLFSDVKFQPVTPAGDDKLSIIGSEGKVSEERPGFAVSGFCPFDFSWRGMRRDMGLRVPVGGGCKEERETRGIS